MSAGVWATPTKEAQEPMNAFFRSLAAFVLLAALPVVAHAESLELSKARQDYLEGVWSGVSADTNANKLCSTTAPPAGAIALTIEFLRSGGMAVADDGSEGSTRGKIVEASEADGIVTLTFGNEVWRMRPENDNIMYRVRSSASIGGDVDTVVFKRCSKAADRSAIALDDGSLQFLAADLPGDEAFFIDERLAAKAGDRCNVKETQYLFFVLLGPSEFRISRWNSFAVADKLAAKKPVKLPLDTVMNWRVDSVRTEGGKYVFAMRDFDDDKAKPETIHVESKGNGIAIPEWKRTYIRCKGFQSRS